METSEFNEETFQNYLVHLIQVYQEGTLTEYKKGAITALLEVSNELHRFIDEQPLNDEKEMENIE